MITVEVTNRQKGTAIDAAALRRAVRQVLDAEGIAKAHISVAVVDHRASQALNRQYLEHDYPTDVLSFELDPDAGHLEGEVVVNAQLATEVAPRFGWSAADELLLYVIHGLLHLAGYEDASRAERARMRRRERRHLAAFGLSPRYRPK